MTHINVASLMLKKTEKNMQIKTMKIVVEIVATIMKCHLRQDLMKDINNTREMRNSLPRTNVKEIIKNRHYIQEVQEKNILPPQQELLSDQIHKEVNHEVIMIGTVQVVVETKIEMMDIEEMLDLEISKKARIEMKKMSIMQETA